MALLSCYPAEYQCRLNFQKACEASNRNVVLQYSDHPEAPAFRPRPLHVPRQEWWSKPAQTRQCYCLWWVSSADPSRHSGNSPVICPDYSFQSCLLNFFKFLWPAHSLSQAPERHSGFQNLTSAFLMHIFPSFSDRPFINLKPRNGLVMMVQAGEKSYKISPKLRAFPAPKVIW